jgi:hypothetical protein
LSAVWPAINRFLPIFGLAATLACAPNALGAPRPTYDNPNTAEGWAWSQIRQGLPADFEDHCGVDLNKQSDIAWLDPRLCRTVSASFLIDLLTEPSLHDGMPHKGVRIGGAKILGDVDLAFMKIDRPIRILDSRFEGDISLAYARAESLIDFSGSVLAGQLVATALHSEDELNLSRTTISTAGLILDRATIAGLIDMDGATARVG